MTLPPIIRHMLFQKFLLHTGTEEVVDHMEMIAIGNGVIKMEEGHVNTKLVQPIVKVARQNYKMLLEISMQHAIQISMK